MKTLLSLIALGLLTGCGLRSFQKQTVVLASKVSVTESALGRNKGVLLVVVDERSTPVIGHRAAGGGAQGAIISAESEPAAVILEAMTKGLMSQGFQIVKTPDASLPRLEIQLRALEYRAGQSVFTLTVAVNAAAKVEVTRGGARVFQKMYTASDERSPFVAPDANWNAEQINAVFSRLLNQILNDRALLDALVECAPPAGKVP